MTRAITVGSLFAGVGGFDLGMERAGMRPAWQVEIDPYARAVLARHWPEARQLADVREVGAHNLQPVDVIVGGFPCQDLSVAGKRAGLAGGRSGLFYEMLRIINELKPSLVIWENVPGLLSSDGGRDFARVLYSLGGIGYHGAWRILNAQFFGVPQRRRRIFGVFTGSDSGAIAGSEILAIANGMQGDSAEGGCQRPDAAGAAAPGAGAEGAELMAQTFQARYVRNGRGAPSVLMPTLAAQNGGTGKGDQAPLVWQARYFSERAEGGPPSDVAPPLRANARNNATAPKVLDSTVRRLTPTECERLQGFPDGWTDGQADAHRYRQMGNAVCVPVAAWIGRRAVDWIHRQRLEALDG